MMDIKEILDKLPQRYPFLLVDRVLAFKKNKSIKALKNVTINEPFFSGHFPAEPVMPGVLIIEAMAQASGLLVLKSDPNISCEKDLFVMAGVNNAKFKRMVKPGDQLILTAVIKKAKAGIWKIDCEASVEDQLAASAEITTVKVNA